jgi:hypothetical protein
MQRFFSALRPDLGLAYVVILHLLRTTRANFRATIVKAAVVTLGLLPVLGAVGV